MTPDLDIGTAPPFESVRAFVADYRPSHGVFDELMDREGHVRPHWQSFMAMLATLGPDEINKRFAAADRHLRDSAGGVAEGHRDGRRRLCAL